MNTCETVAARITQLCKKKKITPFRLANLSGIPASTVKSILNGQSQNPGIVTIDKICKGLDISLIEFFNTKEFAALFQEED